MKRRELFLLPGLLLAASPSKVLRGKLLAGKKLEVGGRIYALDSDKPVGLVLDDERLIDSELEVQGEPAGDGKFKIDEIHTSPLYVYVKGERLGVSYWCDICYIRTYTPGKCVCCQEYTRLDPKDPNTPDRKP